MSKNIVEVTAKNFDEMTSSKQIVLLDFWAPWCAPCKGFASVVEEVAPEFPDVLFGKINIEDESELAQEFQVRSIPAVMILRGQHIVFAESGAMPAKALRELLEKAQALSDEDLASHKTD